MSIVSTIGAIVVFFIAADLVYTLDHYFVHHDRERYRTGHGRHHRRYNGKKDAPQLDAYEVTTYGSAALVSFVGMSAVSLVTGNWAFAAAAVLKFIHSLAFHCYQHHWWSDEVALRKQGLPMPKRGWGFATAKYHAWHHSHPDHEVFTYS